VIQAVFESLYWNMKFIFRVFSSSYKWLKRALYSSNSILWAVFWVHPPCLKILIEAERGMEVEFIYIYSFSSLSNSYSNYLVTVTTWWRLPFRFVTDRVARRQRKYNETTTMDNKITNAVFYGLRFAK